MSLLKAGRPKAMNSRQQALLEKIKSDGKSGMARLNVNIQKAMLVKLKKIGLEQNKTVTEIVLEQLENFIKNHIENA